MNDIHQEIKDKDLTDSFDFSNYPKAHDLYSLQNEGKLGKFKNECSGEIIKEFIGLRSKMYSVELASGKRPPDRPATGNFATDPAKSFQTRQYFYNPASISLGANSSLHLNTMITRSSFRYIGWNGRVAGYFADPGWIVHMILIHLTVQIQLIFSTTQQTVSFQLEYD